MRKIEKNYIEVDGILYEKKEVCSVKNSCGNYSVGDYVLCVNEGAVCTTHTYGKNFEGFKSGAYPERDIPFVVLAFRSIETYRNAVIVGQGANVFVFSRENAFMKIADMSTYLLEIAGHKGYKTGTKYLNDGKIKQVGDFTKMRYHYGSDRSYLTDGYGGAIYKSGVWAEIVEIKKYPADKKELIALLLLYNESTLSISDFVEGNFND